MSVVICQNCGAKIRAGRERCLRCHEKLVAAPVKPGFDFNRLAAAALVGFLCLTSAALLTAWRRGAANVTPAPKVTPARAGAVPKAVVPEGPAAGIGSTFDVPFMESGRAGNAAYGSGEFERALQLYRDAVTRNPGDAESWSNLGQVLVKLNRVDEAVPNFQRAIALNGERWAYHFNLARAQGLAGQWPQAVTEYREAQRLYPDDYAIAFNLGLALRKAGDEAAALEQFQKASALDPQEPTFQLSIAMVYDKLGRRENAAAAYQRTLDLAPEAPEAPQIRARIDALLK